jgi:hypothetical protein
MTSGTIVVATAENADRQANKTIIAPCDDLRCSWRSISFPFGYSGRVQPSSEAMLAEARIRPANLTIAI